MDLVSVSGLGDPERRPPRPAVLQQRRREAPITRDTRADRRMIQRRDGVEARLPRDVVVVQVRKRGGDGAIGQRRDDRPDVAHAGAGVEENRPRVTDEQVVLIDDVIATGGTICAAIDLVQKMQCEIVEVAFLIELTALGGRKRLQGYNMFSLLQY